MNSEQQRRPFVVRRGERAPVWSVGGHFTAKLRGGESEGRFAVVEAIAFRSTEPPLHVHAHEDEAWYILEGRMTFFIDGEEHAAGAGDFVYAPRGLAHAFTVDAEPTRVLVFASPAGFEEFAAELGEPAVSEHPPADLVLPTPEALGPVAARYGIEVVGPPLRVMRGEL